MALVPPPDEQTREERFTSKRMSWDFVLGSMLFIPIWMAWNVLAPVALRFDPYHTDGEKFGLLNLIMSIEQCWSNPILFMALAISGARMLSLLEKRHKEQVELLVLQHAEDREQFKAILSATAALLEEQRDMAADVETIVVEVSDGEEVDTAGD